ncbi:MULTISPECIES: hypothetical protein [unclassified Streptomyces]|uniref:hypothetical protein n=1 Tax=unclassified Streptomyces TaxID=2593676 RepID=UPI0036FE6DD4
MRRRTPAALTALLATTALAGCGIQGSDVVEAGGAPTVVVAPVPESRMLLYFLGPDGALMPVSRDVGLTRFPVPERTEPGDGAGGEADTGDGRPDGTGTGFEIDADLPDTPGLAVVKVLSALLSGPGDADVRAGLTTELPPAGELVRVESDGAGGIRLRTPFPARELSEGAVAQLVCTAAYAADRSGTHAVTVEGPDGALPQTNCAVTSPPEDEG